MKHLIFLLLLILLLPLPAHAGPAAMRLLSVMGSSNVNISTFETGWDGWTNNAQAGLSAISHTGNQSALMQSNASVIGQIFKSVNGRSGFITFWYNTSYNNINRIIVNGVTTLLPTTSSSWVEMSVPISPGMQTVEFNTGEVGFAEMRVDDIRIPIQ